MNGESFDLLLNEIRPELSFNSLYSRFFLEVIENSLQKKVHYTSEIGPYLNNLDNMLLKALFDFNVKFLATFRYLEMKALMVTVFPFIKKEDLKVIKEMRN